jgi:hypothetical protein
MKEIKYGTIQFCSVSVRIFVIPFYFGFGPVSAKLKFSGSDRIRIHNIGGWNEFSALSWDYCRWRMLGIIGSTVGTYGAYCIKKH